MSIETKSELFKNINPEEEKHLQVLENSRPDVAKIIQANPDVFDFVIKKEKQTDPETGQEQEVDRQYLKILGIELKINQEGQGTQFSAGDFKDFSLDKKSLELLKIMATGIKLNQPPLIEGPTDIGKSKSLEYLAYLTNNYLLYQSFSGQTDVTELVGKYVPAVEDVRKRFEQLLQNKKGLKPETIKIIRQLEQENRLTFTIEECKQIALNESLVTPEELEKLQWNWSDGTVPRAMKYDKGCGCWLYFDELGAAEPQILVKINRIFSGDFARLTITENSQNPDIEATYSEWHPKKGELNQFRIVATTNPPAYAGREPFEKDFIRRWVYQRVDKLDKDTFLSRLDFVGHGRQADLPELKKSQTGQAIDLKQVPELDHHLNLLVAEFRELAQKKLDSWEWGRQEQEFRFDDFTDALRVQKYARQMQSPDLVETIKDAIRFYYLGKIEASMPYHYDINWDEKIKTAKETDSQKLTAKDVENQQSEKVKELETLLTEIIEGKIGEKIDGKSIKEKIEQEMVNLNPEIKKQNLSTEVSQLIEKLWTISDQDKGWQEIQTQLEKYEAGLKDISQQIKTGQQEKNITTAIKILEKTKENILKINQLGLAIKNKIENKNKIEFEFDFN